MKRIVLLLLTTLALIACGGDRPAPDPLGQTHQATVTGAFIKPSMTGTAFVNIAGRDWIANCLCVVDAGIWQNKVGVADGASSGLASLTKTGTGGAWNSGASSTANFAGDGYFEFSTSEANADKMAGLSVGDGSQDYSDIRYALYLTGSGGLSVYESGTSRGSVGSYVANDVFRVQRTGTTVTYWKYTSGTLTLLYTSGVSSSGTLNLDTSFWTNGATLKKVNTPSTQYFLFVGADVGGTPQWQHDTNAGGGAYPLAKINATAYDMFYAGSLNTGTGVITYGGNDYKMRLTRDTNGVQVAEPYLYP